MSVCVHRLLKTDVRSMSCLSQAERSTWCAGTKTRPRRRGLISSRRQEIKYSVTHFLKNYGSDWFPRREIVHYSKCHHRRSMSTSWTCLRPRRSGSLLRLSRESTRLSMCWWATDFHILKYKPTLSSLGVCVPIHFSYIVKSVLDQYKSESDSHVLCRLITPAP